MVKKRTGSDVCWSQESTKSENRNKQAIQQLMNNDLTVSSAVQIALLNNPSIQATFEEIGIAHADLIQAGLLQNPFFEGYIRFPNHGSGGNNIEFSLVQNFLDIFLIPLRKKVAEEDLKKAQLRVADAIIQLSFEVQEVFYQLVGAEKIQNNLQLLMEAYDAAFTLATAQKKQGNIHDLELAQRQNEYLEAKIEVSSNARQVKRLREKLNQLLGLTSPALVGNIAQDFPQICDEPNIEFLDSRALSERLEIHILKSELERIERFAKMKKWWSYTDASIGVSTESDIGGGQVTGPSLSTSIPIFNYGQADRERLAALYRKGREQLKAVEVQVVSEVRSAFEQVLINRKLIDIYENQLLPLQKERLSMSLRFYNVMGIGVYQLLTTLRNDFTTQIQYITSLREYWLSKVALERALGGKLHDEKVGGEKREEGQST